METMRKPFQGVWNIMRFNWHYYVLSIVATIVLLLLRNILPMTFHFIVTVLILLIVISTFISLTVSFFIYDLSNLYKLSWLDELQFNNTDKIVNINAGFDETSSLLKSKFINSELAVFDFYDPLKHTEISIKRARKAYPPYPSTQQTTTTHLALQNNSADKIFLTFSAHEIRDSNERISFFKELHRVLSSAGQIIVTEHLRDTVNFLAYNIGFFHFYSKASWLETFKSAELRVASEIKITPFITTFILGRNGIAS